MWVRNTLVAVLIGLHSGVAVTLQKPLSLLGLMILKVKCVCCRLSPPVFCAAACASAAPHVRLHVASRPAAEPGAF